MANQDPQGTLQYWIDGTSCTLIALTELTLVGKQNYWYNGTTQGFLSESSSAINETRNFAVLIGF